MNEVNNPRITDEEAQALVNARLALREISRRAYFEHGTQASGIARYAAEVAENAVFQVVNIFNSYCGQDFTEDVLFPKVTVDA